ncbi:HAD family hydrolase [Paenibacillus sp. HB172176]|uniref:HAD family hydrolase n=1 Tax=Paenibacillus sp. HB172176 TaxID=2493690 RepID=UPI00143A5E68|nr:HAD family hydrolase [Paenibacillus sp. HB172176]
MKQAIFFDMDDTLYDHLLPFRRAIQAWTAGIGDFPYQEAYHRMRYYSDKLSEELGGAGAMGQGAAAEAMRWRRFQLTLADFGIKLKEDAAKAAQASYLACQFDIAMFDGMKELILKLQHEGHITGLITNGESSHQRMKIAAMQLEAFMGKELLFISGEAGWDKPDPRFFRAVNEATGTSAENCLYIGDSWRNDVIGGLNAGWSVIWFNHREAAPGTGHAPHYEATNVAQLAKHVDRHLARARTSAGSGK